MIPFLLAAALLLAPAPVWQPGEIRIDGPSWWWAADVTTTPTVRVDGKPWPALCAPLPGVCTLAPPPGWGLVEVDGETLAARVRLPLVGSTGLLGSGGP